MNWRLGRIAGIELRMHATFILLLAFVAWQYWLDGRSVPAVIEGVGFILALFGCVVLHELGHALTARRYGIGTRDITLLPIGGLARLDRMPDDPVQELWVALAGPAVNVVIAAVLFLVISVTPSPMVPADQLDVSRGPFLERLMIVNVGLVAFNMLPAFPMDGGRVLRALLATRVTYTRATQIAASLGQGMAFLFGFIGLSGYPMLLFIALFVWLGAAQEASMVQMKSALAGIPVSHAMITDFRSVAPGEPLARVVDLLLSGVQQDFPVVDGGHLLGVVLGKDLPGALKRHGDRGLVEDVMRRDVPVVDSHHMLEPALRHLQETGSPIGAVEHNGRIVGLLTLDNVGEFVMVQTSLAQHRADRQRSPADQDEPGRGTISSTTSRTIRRI
ncbi:MAG: site-2 protease family protein [Vicinamibacterales bacterium]